MKAKLPFLILFFIAIIILGLLFMFSHTQPSIHPNIKKYQLIQLDLNDIKGKITRNESFQIELNKKQLTISLKRNPVTDAHSKIIIIQEDSKTEESLIDNINYAGNILVEGNKSYARFAIADKYLLGALYFDDDLWFLEPLVIFDNGAPETDYVAYKMSDVTIKLDLSNDILLDKSKVSMLGHPTIPSILEIFDVDEAEAIAVRVEAQDRYLVYIILVADRDFADVMDIVWRPIGWGWREIQLFFLNTVNLIYEDVNQLNMQFIVRNQIRFGFATTDGPRLLDTLELLIENEFGDLYDQDYRRNNLADIAHLTTMKETAGVLGLADGAPGRYSFSRGWREEPDEIYANWIVTMAHELGHNLGGFHDEADKWCNTSFIVCTDYVSSLMWGEGESLEDRLVIFSRGTVNINHNNLRGVNEYMQNNVDVIGIICSDCH